MSKNIICSGSLQIYTTFVREGLSPQDARAYIDVVPQQTARCTAYSVKTTTDYRSPYSGTHLMVRITNHPRGPVSSSHEERLHVDFEYTKERLSMSGPNQFLEVLGNFRTTARTSSARLTVCTGSRFIKDVTDVTSQATLLKTSAFLDAAGFAHPITRKNLHQKSFLLEENDDIEWRLSIVSLDLWKRNALATGVVLMLQSDNSVLARCRSEPLSLGLELSLHCKSPLEGSPTKLAPYMRRLLTLKECWSKMLASGTPRYT